MHKRGFQGLRIVPTMQERPFSWLCHIVIATDMAPGHGSYGRVEMGSSLPYFSPDDAQYVWASRPDTSARELADQLEHGGLSSWLEPARIDDFAYAGWYVKMLGMAERGYLPTVAANGEIVDGNAPLPLFAWPDGTVPPGRHELPPAPHPARDSH